MPVPYLKPPLTFQQQVDKLKQRGMTVRDEPQALVTLSCVSYYRLSAYWHPFRQPGGGFQPGTTFETAVELYEFDRRLRLLVFSAIERIEVHLRTLLTYRLGHDQGPFGYTSSSAFVENFKHPEWLVGVRREVERSRETFVSHFKTKYSGFPAVPVWMASELMSFGSLSRLFLGLHQRQQQDVLTEWNVTTVVAESWCHALTYVRNLCAHHARLWNKELAIKPRLPARDQRWKRMNNGRVYSVLCILQHMLRGKPGTADWSTRAKHLLGEVAAHPTRQTAMGCPVDWAQQSFWQP